MEVEKARDVIREGGIVIFPTETAYGIAADALNPEAVERVFEAKQRPREKGLTVIVDSLETAERYADLSDEERRIVEELMPGPLTLVSEKKDNVPHNLNEQFVFRVSSGKVASE
ncbi:MAG: L-threonylcarbamoyladenylate synthase [Candidatus Nanohaloarchaea archaeon]